MKRLFLAGCVVALILSSGGSLAARAQGGLGQGPDPSVVRDPDLEKESKHNLEVARHYFKLKKAYRAAIARCEEIIAGDPTYSRLDEVLYIAAMSSLRLSENRGKQAPNIPVEKLREDAREYLKRIVDEYPQSEFRERAEEQLRALGVAKPSAQLSPSLKQRASIN